MSVHSTKQITSRDDECEAKKMGNIFFTTAPGSRASTPRLCFAFLTHGLHIMLFDTDGRQGSSLNVGDESVFIFLGSNICLRCNTL